MLVYKILHSLILSKIYSVRLGLSMITFVELGLDIIIEVLGSASFQRCACA